MAIGTTAAILASAAISAGTSIYSSSQANKATDKAVAAQTSAADEAARLQAQTAANALALQASTYQQGRADQAPWLQAGTAALQRLSQMYGLQTPQQAAPAPAAAPQAPAAPAAPMAQAPVYGATGQDSAAASYLQANPDVRAEYERLSPNNLRNNYGITTPEEFAQWHYQASGQSEGRTWDSAPSPVAQIPGGETAVQDYPTDTYSGGQPAAAETPYTTQLGTDAAPAAPDYSEFYKSPDYQFRMDEGLKALSARNAAQGAQNSGAAQKAIIKYAGNVAASSYDSYVAKLQSLAGLGQAAASGQAAQGQSYANTVNSINQGATATTNALSLNNADNLASSYLGNATTNANLAGSLGGYASGLIQNFAGNGMAQGVNTPPFIPNQSATGYGLNTAYT